MLGGISGLTRMASEFGLTAGQALFRMGVVAAATAGAIMDINNALTQTQEERDKFGDDTAGWIGQAFSDLAGVVVAGVAGLVAFLAGGPVAWIAGVAYLVYKGIDWLFGMFGISISDGIGHVAKWIYEGASWLISGLWDVISSAWDSLSGWIGGLWDNIKSFFSQMWDWLDGFMPWNWFGDSDASVSDPASDIISGSVTESLKQVMEKHSERVIEKESARGEATTPFLIKMVQSLEKIESHSRPRTGYQTG
jgi:phage-related protein